MARRKSAGAEGEPPKKKRMRRIEFLKADENLETKIETTSCQVCGSPLQDGIVACSECKTVHHRECFDYNLECATFGCENTAYIPASYQNGKLVIGDAEPEESQPVCPRCGKPTPRGGVCYPCQGREPAEHSTSRPRPGFGERLYDRVRDIFSGIFSVKTGMLAATVACAAALFWGAGVYKASQERVETQFVERVRREDGGKIAYSSERTAYILPVDRLLQDSARHYALPDKPQGLLWNDNGRTLYYVVDEGNILDTTHRIDALDTNTGLTSPWISLKDAELGDDDIDLERLCTHQGRIYFRLNNGSWASAGTLVPNDVRKEAELPVGARDQRYCASGMHGLKTESGLKLYDRNGTEAKLTDGSKTISAFAWWLPPKE